MKIHNIAKLIKRQSHSYKNLNFNTTSDNKDSDFEFSGEMEKFLVHQTELDKLTDVQPTKSKIFNNVNRADKIQLIKFEAEGDGLTFIKASSVGQLIRHWLRDGPSPRLDLQAQGRCVPVPGPQLRRQQPLPQENERGGEDQRE